MLRYIAIAGCLALVTGCATHAPQPAVYPGSTTGILEYVNTTDERHAVSGQRCGDINQQTYVAMGGDTSVAKIPPGESRQISMTTGCYSIFAGPDRMTFSFQAVTLNIRPSDEGFTRMTSNGAITFIKTE